MALFAAHGVALSLSPWCRVASREPWSAFHPACFLCLPGRASLSPVAKPARRPGALDNPVWCVPAGGPRRHRTQVPTLAAPQGAAAGGRDGSPATAYPSWCSPSYRRWRRQRGGRPERAKTYGKKREHGLDSGDSGLTTGAYVLSPAQGGGLLRAIIACNPHWLACCRGGRRIARNKPGGLTRGITLRAIQATPATPAAESNPQWLLQFRASLAREDLSPATLRGYVYDLRHFLRWHQGLQDGGVSPNRRKFRRWSRPGRSGSSHHRDHDGQSDQKALKRSAANSVYRVVCSMLRWPR